MKKSNILSVCVLLAVVLVTVGCQSQGNNSQNLPISVNQPVNEKNGWQIFTSSEVINDILIEENVLWIATEGGVVRWEPKTDIYWKYTTLDGLASNKVSCLIKDASGNFWFGTDNGLSKYDGNTWHTFTTKEGLKSNNITAIAQDKKGGLWVIWVSYYHQTADVVVKSQGIDFYDGTTWQTITTKDGLASDTVNKIFCDNQGNLWFGTYKGLSKYDGNDWQKYTTKDGLPNDSATPYTQDKKGNLWFITNDGVGYWNGKAWRTYSESDGLGNNYVIDITTDSNGKIWFSHGDGITCYDGKSWQYFTKKDGLPTDYIFRLTPDDNGNIWFSTFKRESSNTLRATGLGYYDGHEWRASSYSRGLTSNTISAIAVDENGNIWCGLESGFGGVGVGCYNGVDWRIFTTEGGFLSNSVTDIVPDKNGKLWFNFFGGAVGQYDGEHWIPLKTESGLAVGSASRDSEGNIWFINKAGIGWYDGVSWHTFIGIGIESLPKIIFNRYISRDARGEVWLADYTNLWRYDGAAWQSFSEELDGKTISSIFSDSQGNVWVGLFYSDYNPSSQTYTYNIKRFDGKIWSTFSSDEMVNSIFQDKTGNLWFCTNSGLKRYDGTTWHTFTTEDGLASNQVTGIAEDNGIFWIATRGGINSYDSNGGE